MLVELQAVILACGDGARLYPLTDDLPAALLPVLNRPLLQYQLDLLARATFGEVLVVLSQETAPQISRFLDEYDGPVRVRTVTVDGTVDSADALRQVRDKILGDFAVLPCDIVCEEVLRDLASLHRQRGADVTMLLVEETPDETVKGKKVARPKRDREDVDCIGLTPQGRVLVKAPALDIEDAISVQKALLKRGDSLTLSLRLQDANVYIFAYGVLDFLEEHRHLTNLQSEVVPALVRRQFRAGSGPVTERILASRRAPAAEAGARSAPGVSLAGADAELLASRSSGTAPEGELSLAGDALRCYALVLRHGGKGARFCVQARTLAAYMNLNRDLMTVLPAAAAAAAAPPAAVGGSGSSGSDGVWALPPGFNRKDQVVLGSGCKVGEKVACKVSVVGANCDIGPRCKMNGCVLMEGVTIGAGCTIQNCVVGANATIEEGCNLNDCQVAALTTVAAATKAKQETFSRF